MVSSVRTGRGLKLDEGSEDLVHSIAHTSHGNHELLGTMVTMHGGY